VPHKGKTQCPSRWTTSSRIHANVKALRDAAECARQGDVRGAYESLIRRGTVPYLGPAFFTKFLYFASNQDDPRCLILDARVARSLYRMGWSMAPTYPSRSFSFNWYTDTYVSYCELLTRWADAAKTRPDLFERRLFEEGKGEYQRR
jgi:hypothetical protein